MIKEYIFEINRWKKEDFMYAYSPACIKHTEFLQNESCISNSFSEEINDFNYISMVTKEKYKSGVTISTKCSFERFGAPLVVISNDINNTDGINIYGLHFEIVAYEKGINVWRIVAWPENTQRPIKTLKIGCLEFDVKNNNAFDLKVQVVNNGFICTLNEKSLKVESCEIPESFHIGITACEGINHFYDLKISD